MKFILGRITVSISFWFMAVITLLLTLAPRVPAAASFMFCVLHELGHLAAMTAVGQRPRRIELGYFGIKIVASSGLISQTGDFFIAVAGPITNLIAAVICYFAGRQDFFTINLALAIFNLLPVGVLDGGRALKCITGDSQAVRKIEYACAIIITAIGVVCAIYSKGNFTLLIVSLYLVIGIITTKP
ncbi:MAG: site-2 protease family protein [Clostridia bacterium]|nr:site-2 protease family protein [Clostridia bacterium]